MPTLPNVPNVAKIQLRQTLGTDSNVMNGFHCRFTGTSDEADLNAWGLAIATAWTSHIAPMLSSELVLNEVILTDLTSATAATGSNIANHPGGGTVLSVPANVSLLVQFQMNRRYRGGRPRQYMAGLNQNELQDEDHWLVTTINNWEAAYTLFMQTVQTFAAGSVSATQIVNVSYVSGHTWEQDTHGNWHRVPVYRTSPQVDTINGYTVNPIVCTQRRRARA